MSDDRRSVRFFVSGIVQGVGYRHFARHAALRLGLTGYVKNLNDGRVEVYAEGPRTAIAALRQELERGPLGASVTGVEEVKVKHNPGSHVSFSIEYDD